MKLIVAPIVAMDSERVIGVDGTIPWHLPADLKRFAALTTGHTVLMGRKTFDSLPPKYRPLPKRTNVVVSRSAAAHAAADGVPGVEWVSDPVQYLNDCLSGGAALRSDRIWIIGGETIYRATMPYWNEVHVTAVDGVHRGDTYFPEFEQGYELLGSETPADGGCRFLTYARK